MDLIINTDVGISPSILGVIIANKSNLNDSPSLLTVSSSGYEFDENGDHVLEDMYCMKVDSEDQAWSCQGTVTHNTEITLHTNKDEVAVCNLASVNISKHVTLDGGINHELLRKTIRVAMRGLDNVIDYNFYPIAEAERSNLMHRPVGLGVMGVQDALHILNINTASEDAVEFNDRMMEAISYYAIEASALLAKEKGKHPSYEGSLWSKGIFPMDSYDALMIQRGTDYRSTPTMDWDYVRGLVKEHGMRNSNVLAIAPTASISNLTGASACTEPYYKQLFTKANLSGNFLVVNKYMVEDLKKYALWDDQTISDLQDNQGFLGDIPYIPEVLKEKYKTSFELDQRWIIDAAAKRSTWIDQGQSVNLFVRFFDSEEDKGEKLSNIYRYAWQKGLKSTYYMRTLSATDTDVDGTKYLADLEEGCVSCQ